MFAGLTRTVEPAAAAVDIDNLKDFLKITDTSSDAALSLRIAEATDLIEIDSGRALIDQTFRAIYDGIGTSREFVLPRPPVQSVTSLEYRNTGGTWSTIDSVDYDLNTDREPAIVRIRSGAIPTVHGTIRPSYKITYIAGYGSTYASVPAAIQAAIMQVAAALFDGCSDSALPAVHPMIQRYKVPRVTYCRDIIPAVAP